MQEWGRGLYRGRGALAAPAKGNGQEAQQAAPSSVCCVLHGGLVSQSPVALLTGAGKGERRDGALKVAAQSGGVQRSLMSGWTSKFDLCDSVKEGAQACILQKSLVSEDNQVKCCNKVKDGTDGFISHSLEDPGA